MPLPSLNAIRAFESAARLLSFKEASQELKLTPSAVSRHIRSLERAIGVRLFKRGFRQVQLTKEAAPYAQRLSDAFKIIEDATEIMGAYEPPRRRKRRRFTICSNATVMNLWLADRLPRFQSLYPECDFEVSINDDHGEGGNPDADLRILLLPDTVDDPNFTRLISLILIPVCSPALLTGSNALRSPADLARHPLLHEASTADWEEWIKDERVKGVDGKSGPIFHDPSLTVRVAMNGGGVALVDNIMAQDLLARGQLVVPFPIRRHYPFCYFLGQRPGASSIIGVRQFRQWLESEIELHKVAMRLG